MNENYADDVKISGSAQRLNESGVTRLAKSSLKA